MVDWIEFWSFLAARKIKHLLGPDFENLKHLENLELLSNTLPYILISIIKS